MEHNLYARQQYSVVSRILLLYTCGKKVTYAFGIFHIYIYLSFYRKPSLILMQGPNLYLILFDTTYSHMGEENKPVWSI